MLKIKLTSPQRRKLKTYFQDRGLSDSLEEIFGPIYEKYEKKTLRSLMTTDKEIGKAIGILDTLDAILGLNDKILGKESSENE